MANKFKDLVSAPSNPSQLVSYTFADDDDVTVITSNVSSLHLAQLASQPLRVDIDPTHGIADTGATLIFVQEGIQVPNLQVARNPLTVNLPNGRQVRSTHTCNVIVPGLPTPLTGHVIPDLAMASLFGIRPLCNAGCVVIFHKDRVEVQSRGKVILIGPRNLCTDLWTLPVTPKQTTLLLSSTIERTTQCRRLSQLSPTLCERE